MYTKRVCIVAQFLALSLCGAVRFEQTAKVIDCYDFTEVAINVSKPQPGNPFLDTEISGEFGREGEPANVHVDGFCDSEDGSLFKIRFMPAAAGRYTYSVIYKRGADEWHHTGSFAARAGNRKGIVRVDQEYPTHFLYEGTGEHFFYNSTTAYWLLGWNDESVIREAIDRLAHLKINRIRTALSARTTSGMRWKEPMVISDANFQFRLAPWPAARPEDIPNPGYDVTRFNLEHFRKTERMLAHARKRNVNVSLIFALDVADKGVDPFGGKASTGNVDEQRYYRYSVARFAAFANVWWDLINEWHLCRSQAWVNKMGKLVKIWDPYDHLTSVHGTTAFPFNTQPWVDYIMFQSWDEHGAFEFMLKAREVQTATNRPVPIINEEYGYEDHYPYPWGEKRIWPARIAESRVRLAWEMMMAGGYQTTGERANIANMGGWITGRGNKEMTMLDGYARLREFFERFEWWKLEPHPDLVAGESKALPVVENGKAAAVYCLAEPGVRYILYLRQGGTATAQLAPGQYSVRRFNPRNGKYDKAGFASDPSWSTPPLPDTEPWVFLVERNR